MAEGRGNRALLVKVWLRGSAAYLSYPHSRGIVHGSGKSEMDLTSEHDLMSYTVKCVSFHNSLSNVPRAPSCESVFDSGTRRYGRAHV